MSSEAILSVQLEEVPLLKKGKVREVYGLNETLLIVATDRISAFDVIMPNGIPDKGRILTAMSRFWFMKFAGLVENHLLSTDLEEISSHSGLTFSRPDLLEGRTMLVRKTEPIPIECVVRGYLAGSGWKEYRESGSVCGIRLPPGLREADRLPEPIFTPATKEESGHDMNISPDEARNMLEEEAYRFISETSLGIYGEGAAFARERGIIVADTKFEFGRLEDRIILIDEVLTPDSSRFWPVADYRPGESPKSFDKQYVRDYLESTGWDKTPPAPPLPPDVVRKTREKYQEAQRLLMA